MRRQMRPRLAAHDHRDGATAHAEPLRNVLVGETERGLRADLLDSNRVQLLTTERVIATLADRIVDVLGPCCGDKMCGVDAPTVIAPIAHDVALRDGTDE
jgi:hypothetical protein